MAYDEGLATRVREVLGDRPGLAERKMYGASPSCWATTILSFGQESEAACARSASSRLKSGISLLTWVRQVLEEISAAASVWTG
jgi:hypothetical protein